MITGQRADNYAFNQWTVTDDKKEQRTANSTLPKAGRQW
jgi:hypothetical protein